MLLNLHDFRRLGVVAVAPPFVLNRSVTTQEGLERFSSITLLFQQKPYMTNQKIYIIERRWMRILMNGYLFLESRRPPHQLPLQSTCLPETAAPSSFSWFSSLRLDLFFTWIYQIKIYFRFLIFQLPFSYDLGFWNFSFKIRDFL